MRKVVLFEGIDISSRDGVVDIKRVRNAGCRMVAIRAGYGKNNVDQRFVANAQACYNLNVPIMAYWLSYALNEEMAQNEAKFIIALISKYWDTCAIAYDGEYDTVRYARTKGVNLTKEKFTDMAIAYLNTVKNAGYIPVLYTNKEHYRNYFDVDKIVSALGVVYIWYARHNVSELTEEEEEIADVWQYTSKGQIDGVGDNVDLNRFYNELEYISVKAKKQNATENVNIRNFQAAANADGYKDWNGEKLSVNGIDGAETQYVRKQIQLEAKKTSFRYKVGSKGVTVKWLQRRCNEILGTNYEMDGLYGKDTRKIVMAVQEKLNLEVNGMAGYDTIQALFYN